jgi:hypothetical protein
LTDPPGTLEAHARLEILQEERRVLAASTEGEDVSSRIGAAEYVRECLEFEDIQ